MDKKSCDCAMWMREKCGIETLKESLDYSQKQNSQAQAEIVSLKDALSHNADRYTVEVRNYATDTVLFLYSFDRDPQVGDVIVMGRSEFPIIGRRWTDGKLCLLVSNAGVVKG